MPAVPLGGVQGPISGSEGVTHVSLFSGIDGIGLAAEWAGFETVAQVENDPYCIGVLRKHWPRVHRWADIKAFPNTAPMFWEAVKWDEPDGDVQSYESSTGIPGPALGPITLVSGGFPCQPFSHAGKRGGTGDDRYLWPEMLRVIREIEPQWVLAENVLGLMSLESGVVFETVLSDLEAAGYETLPVVCPAAGAGAPHLRQRVFIVAHAEYRGLVDVQPGNPPREGNPKKTDVACGAYVAHTTRERLDGPGGARGRRGESTDGSGSDAPDADQLDDDGSRHGTGEARRQRRKAPELSGGEDAPDTGRRGGEGPRAEQRGGPVASWWESEPGVGRVATGVPHRVDRLRALGNAVNPYQVAPILQAIAEVEREF